MLKSIHKFTYPRWDDQIYCSNGGFAFKAGHSKLHECETCMTSEFPYTLCKHCHSEGMHSNHGKFRQKKMKEFLAG